MHPYRNFLAVIRKKKFWMHASNVVCAEGGGAEHVWIKKELHKYESVPRPMSMMVDLCSVSD